MEELIKKHFPHYTILRIGLITWGTNPNTLINFFRKRVVDGLPLEIQDTVRYVLDKDDFLHWVNKIPDWNSEMNITGTRMTINQIINKYVYSGLRFK